MDLKAVAKHLRPHYLTSHIRASVFKGLKGFKRANYICRLCSEAVVTSG